VWLVCTSSAISHVNINDSFTEDLTSKKRYTEAGHVLLDYAEDDREAIIALVQGNQFSEARRIVSRTSHLLS
jgi:elongator complex protein 1